MTTAVAADEPAGPRPSLASMHVITTTSTDDRDRLAFVLAMHLLHVEAQPVTAIVGPTRVEARVAWDKVAAASSHMVRRISRANGAEVIESIAGARLLCATGRGDGLRGVSVGRLIVLSGDLLSGPQRAWLIPSLVARPDAEWWEFNVAA